MENLNNVSIVPAQIPKFPITIHENEIKEGALKILNKLRPDWTANTQLTSKIFTDGITNKLIGYYLPDNPRDVVIIKIYGPKTEEMIDRELEINTMILLNSNQLGPALYGIFQNGIVYEYLPGSILTVDSVRDPAIFPIVAFEMGKLHSIPIPKGRNTHGLIIWEKVHKFIELGDEILTTNQTIRKQYEQHGIVAGWGKKAVAELEDIIENLKMPIVLGHNDLLLANIIYDKEHSSVSFIDFEYCGPTYAAFDIANHFNEFGGVENPDFSLCPDDSFKSKWISEYLKHNQTNKISQEEMELWVKICIPMSHLFWILWTVVQAQNSTIDFDYINYGALRIPEYEKWIQIVRKMMKK